MLMSRRKVCYVCLGLLTFALLPGVMVQTCAAAAKPVASLDLVPENAAFYTVMLRNREQWDAIAGSRAWAKLKALPLVQMGWGLWAIQSADPDSVPGKIQAALRDPELKKSLDFLGDIVSDEVFLYGGANAADLMELAQILNGAQRFGPLFSELTGEGKGVSKQKLRKMSIVSALAENINLLKVPEGVIGFKVKNLALAKRQLDLLEKQASAALEEKPELKKRLKRTTVEGHPFLTFTLDGRLVPSWDEATAELRKQESEPGEADKVIARLKSLKLVIAAGLRDDYLLVSIGPSTDVIARLGKGKSLRGRAELAPLAKFADKRLTSVAYLSKAMYAQVGTSKRDIDGLVETVDALLSLDSIPKEALPKEARDEIRKDTAELAKDIKRLIPEPGAILGISFLNGTGWETYAYNWGENRELDGSRPLGLLEHVGGSPIIAAVERTKVSVEDYDLLAKWVGVGYRYFEKYAVPHMKPNERAQFEKFMKDARPLARRLDEANRKMLLPSLADGQVGVVADVKLTSKQFVSALPPTPKAMPMLEPALVLGVSDAELLRKACAEYRAVADGLLAAARKIEGNEIPPDFKIPDVKTTKVKQGTLYYYPLPKQWGVDAKVLPNAGLSEHVAVLTISRGHSERLLTKTPPTVGGKALPTSRPLAGAAAVDFAGLIDAIAPWVDLAFDTAKEQNESSAGNIETFRQQAHTVLDVLKVFRGAVTETSLDGKVLVSHTRTEVRDVEK